MQKRIWITWEEQRRSLELAKRFGCELFSIKQLGILRYPRSIARTISLMRKAKADVVFVQNPSMLLATIACVYRLLSRRTHLVVDRHTTFLLNKKNTNTPFFIIFKILHRFTVRFADVTIVTNEHLAALVTALNGHPVVLPDCLPRLSGPGKQWPLKGKFNIVLISSFGSDEPIREAFEAMKLIQSDDVFLYVTGNSHRLNQHVKATMPSNVILTGFIPEQDFADLLFSADACMALTTADSCMLCGCYEAVSAERALITSNKRALKDYFKGAVFVPNTPQGIAAGINAIVKDPGTHQGRITQLKAELDPQWEQAFSTFNNTLLQMH